MSGGNLHGYNPKNKTSVNDQSGEHHDSLTEAANLEHEQIDNAHRRELKNLRASKMLWIWAVIIHLKSIAIVYSQDDFIWAFLCAVVPVLSDLLVLFVVIANEGFMDTFCVMVYAFMAMLWMDVTWTDRAKSYLEQITQYRKICAGLRLERGQVEAKNFILEQKASDSKEESQRARRKAEHMEKIAVKFGREQLEKTRKAVEEKIKLQDELSRLREKSINDKRNMTN